MNEISVSDTGLSTLLHSGAGLPVSLTRDIFLTRQSVVGTRYVGGAEDLVEELEKGSRVILLHEADNRFDKKAVMVLDAKGRKLGYLPRYQNAVIAALLDAGKVFYGLVSEKPERYDEGNDTSPYRMDIDLYMREFVDPEEMNAVPRHGDRGSYAVAAIEVSDGEAEGEESDRQDHSSPAEEGRKPWICGLYVIKVINGEERGHFQKRILPEAGREERRFAFKMFDEFTGYLPLVSHGINGDKLDLLSEGYGILLGQPLSNHVIDTEQMGRTHLPEIRDTSLSSYAKYLGIACEAESEPEKECRLVWELYRRLSRSELEAHDQFPTA